ncbi:hypothetical protein NDU88_009698 [Pleurodeles waltl]|uniref:Uncharacterized protein n=1 Tax=Pleurodeles waltl TaxID=8319 RepID=A0AAV7PSV3_PLEWA|nr:hypothetical protein NDU88_009698 [Pleurodeles waltl]
MASILAEILAAVKLSKSSVAPEPASKSDLEKLQQVNHESSQLGRVQDIFDQKPSFEPCPGDVLDAEKDPMGLLCKEILRFESLVYSLLQNSPTRSQDGALSKAKPPMTKRYHKSLRKARNNKQNKEIVPTLLRPGRLRPSKEDHDLSKSRPLYPLFPTKRTTQPLAV